jgi:hypothetical protein
MAKYRRVAFIAETMERLGEKNYLENFFKSKLGEMALLTESTGGRLFSPPDISALQGVYEQVARELKSQLLLTYIPNTMVAQGTYCEIQLVHRLPEVQLLFRRGYYSRD